MDSATRSPEAVRPQAEKAEQGAAASAERTAPSTRAARPATGAAIADVEEAGAGAMADEEDEEETGIQPKSKESYFNYALSLFRISKHHWQRGELDKAIETLDQAYSIILDVDPENDPKLLQEKEDLRIAVSRRVLEIYASRQVVVNGRRNEIPITLNRHVQEEIDSFTLGRERDFFIGAYRRSGKFRPRIETALKEAGLPAELSWLPLIESGFKLTALSAARALGLWQFIPSTGYRYGLNRDLHIDERLDPEKSTRAAIDYLKDLHGMFGDWTTVLAAYNCGEHRVLRTIESQNINYLDQFWDLYEKLPRETARYVPRFLATLHIVGSPQQYGLVDVPLAAPAAYETVSIPKQTGLREIARIAGLDEGQLHDLNAELRQGILPAEGYELKVPPGEAAEVLARIDELPTVFARETERPRRATVAVLQHKVRPGETAASIARKYGVDPAAILQANGLHKNAALAPGKQLKITMAAAPAERPAPSAAGGKTPAQRPETIEHTVRTGDSLWNIARRYGTTAESIQRLNRVTPSSLTVGQVLKINPVQPMKNEPGRAERKPSKPQTHTVRSGETPVTIAKLHRMSVERLLQLNRIEGRAKIKPGQTLIVE